jgi:membrane peptidoglycan carboxypeptidase
VNKPEAALKKRNEVLKKMYDEQVITQKQYDSSVKKKIKIQQLTKDGTNESYVVSYPLCCAGSDGKGRFQIPVYV